jgi:hypothetical protein
MSVSEPLPLLQSNWSLSFIVCESKQHTVYAGDYNNKKLIVIKNQSPVYIDMEKEPNKGVLMKEDT